MADEPAQAASRVRLPKGIALELQLCAYLHTEPLMYFRRKTSGGRAYLQIVESRREGDQVRDLPK